MPALFSVSLLAREYNMSRGFTLIEMVMVLVIVGAFSALAVPQMSPGDTTINAQADRFAQDLRHAQSLAMSQGRTLTLETVSPTRYRITDGGAPATVIRDPAGELLDVTLEHGVVLTGPTIRFDSLGRPRTAASLSTAVQNWTFTSASRSAAIALQPVTGFVTVSP